jgi:hypothetical protein
LEKGAKVPFDHPLAGNTLTRMTRHTEVITLDGMLHGDGCEARCTVAAMRVTEEGFPARITHPRIVDVEENLPDGDYVLTCNGERSAVRFKNGSWISR